MGKMITIRQIQPNDWELFKSLRLKAMSDAPQAFGETLEEAKQMPDSRWKALTKCNSEGRESICALAFNIKEPIGIIVGGLDDHVKDRAHVVTAWIEPGLRGKGIAESLFRFISDWADIAGAKVLTAEVNMHNLRAQAFYRKMGFELLDEQPFITPEPTKSQKSLKKIMTIQKTHEKSNYPFLKRNFMESLDKREDSRVSCLIPVTFLFKDRVFTEFIRNISQKGIYIESDVHASEGSELILSYQSTETGPFKGIGKVVWATTEGMGIRLH